MRLDTRTAAACESLPVADQEQLEREQLGRLEQLEQLAPVVRVAVRDEIDAIRREREREEEDGQLVAAGRLLWLALSAVAASLWLTLHPRR